MKFLRKKLEKKQHLSCLRDKGRAQRRHMGLLRKYKRHSDKKIVAERFKYLKTVPRFIQNDSQSPTHYELDSSLEIFSQACGANS